MKSCPKCAAEYPDDVNFCPMDATRLTEKPKAAVAAVPVRGWTAAFTEVDKNELLKKGKEDAEKAAAAEKAAQVAAAEKAKPAVAAVPVRGWTAAFTEVEKNELLKKGKEDAQKAKSPIPTEVPLRGWTAAISTIDASAIAAATTPVETPVAASVETPVAASVETPVAAPAETPVEARPPESDEHTRPTVSMAAVAAAEAALEVQEPAKPEVAPVAPAPTPAVAVAAPLDRKSEELDDKQMLTAVRGSRIGVIVAGGLVGAIVMSVILYLLATR